MKRFLTAALAAVMLLSFSACGGNDAEEPSGDAPETVIEVEPGGSPEAGKENGAGEAPAEESAEAPAEDTAMAAVRYYHGDDNAEKIIEEQAELPEGFTPQDVIDLLIEKAVLPEGIKVNKWDKTDAGVMNIDFDAAFGRAIQSTGTAGEYIMLGSTVNSLISDFGVTGVSVTVDGEVLASGHEIYDYILEFYE